MAIQLSDAAAAELVRIMCEQNLGDDTSLRLGVRGGGCSGFNYSLGFTDDPESDVDQVFYSHGIKILCDPKSFLYLNGVTIDYEQSLMARGFKFINPNATGSCGCGESFSV
jgi:iron-sulfur cluster assembly protein